MRILSVSCMLALHDAEAASQQAWQISFAGLADVCHQFGTTLIVDEAHGSHFAFHSAFPQVTALSYGI